MKPLRKSELKELAEMICGNPPYRHFPYRKTDALTGFFRGLGLRQVYSGRTRAKWVLSVLERLNSRSSRSPLMPSDDLTTVIEGLLDREAFGTSDSYDYDIAVSQIEDLLRPLDLAILKQPEAKSVKIVPVCSTYVSSDINPERILTFAPEVFKVPDEPLDPKLLAVLIPMRDSFEEVYQAIKLASERLGLKAKRVDERWKGSEIYQDIFDMICCAGRVIADLSGANPNVMYEIGIAHTLGKDVIPITRCIDDVPYDLQHHRAIRYSTTSKGMKRLSDQLSRRLERKA